MDYFSTFSSPPEIPARSPLRNSSFYHDTKAQHLLQSPQHERDACLDRGHYTVLSGKFDDMLGTIRSDWQLASIVDQEPHCNYVNDASSSIYSESSIGDNDPLTPAIELFSRPLSLGATYNRDAFSPTESWSSETSEFRQEELWTATKSLHIRRDSIADDDEDPDSLPIVTTQQVFDIVENLPKRLDTYNLSANSEGVEYGVPFSYSKAPARKQKDEPVQFVRKEAGSPRRSPSLLSRTSSIRVAAKRLLTL